jgi:hypothetical protein
VTRRITQQFLVDKASRIADSMQEFALRATWELSNSSQRLNSVSSRVQSLSLSINQPIVPMKDQEEDQDQDQEEDGGREEAPKYGFRELGAGLVFDQTKGRFVVGMIRMPVVALEE